MKLTINSYDKINFRKLVGKTIIMKVGKDKYDSRAYFTSWFIHKGQEHLTFIQDGNGYNKIKIPVMILKHKLLEQEIELIHKNENDIAILYYNI